MYFRLQLHNCTFKTHNKFLIKYSHYFIMKYYLNIYHKKILISSWNQQIFCKKDIQSILFKTLIDNERKHFFFKSKLSIKCSFYFALTYKSIYLLFFKSDLSITCSSDFEFTYRRVSDMCFKLLLLKIAGNCYVSITTSVQGYYLVVIRRYRFQKSVKKKLD